MDRRLSLHSNFFSSLKQVEKRLKLDNSETDPTPTESLCSPLYLYIDHNHSITANQNSNLENSETPVEFLSNSIDFPQTHENPPLQYPQHDAQVVNCVENDVDDIGRLIELLGLSEFERDDLKGTPNQEEMNTTCSSCHCVGGFYEKIVGIKGPKCGKEMERLDGWIKHFGAEKIEPFRLAHLLLGKATCIKDDDGDGSGFEAVDFPSTVEEYLRHDPLVRSKQEGTSG